MKHYILLKAKDDVDRSELFSTIDELFTFARTLEGIEAVETLCSRANNPKLYDFLICMEGSKAAIQGFDVTEEHLAWKDEHAGKLAGKAVFDTE